MDSARPRYPETAEALEKRRQRIRNQLARFGLTYHQGGRVLGGVTAAPTRSLEALLRAKDLRGMEVEFERALENVLQDPATAITAASSIVESLCKIYIQDEGLEQPSDQTIQPLWKVVQKHLGLDPAQIEDDDLKRILTGLASVVDGLGALRTHIGSADGRGRMTYKAEPRHARLAARRRSAPLTPASTAVPSPLRDGTEPLSHGGTEREAEEGLAPITSATAESLQPC